MRQRAEPGSSTNRGKVIWVLASSRPDLIEMDLKRPGRVDLKIPLFPTTTSREGFDLLKMLCAKRGLNVEQAWLTPLESNIPALLTPGAAEVLGTKVYRQVRTTAWSLEGALSDCLNEYQNPIAQVVMAFQIRIATDEASALEFVPAKNSVRSANTALDLLCDRIAASLSLSEDVRSLTGR